MNIKQEMLTPNKWSRPTTKLKAVKAIIIHWVANPKTSAMANRNFFENRKHGKTGFGSAHFFVDLDGSYLQCLPEDEVAYHVGAKTYKELALKNISTYPNDSSLGIEVTHEDWTGRFSIIVELATAKLTAYLLKKYNLTVEDVYRHYDITGKDCPKYYVEHTKEWERLLSIIKKELQALESNSKEKSTNQSKTYTVVKGDTLWGISNKFGISVEQLKTLNGLKSDTITIGQNLQLSSNPQAPSTSTTSTKSTSGVTHSIFGQSKISAKHMTNFLKKKGISIDSHIPEAFINVGERYGIRGDIAFAQSIIETGWFRFDGGTAVDPSQHNYCGLGVTKKGERGWSFKTIEEGVTAQIQHLYAYATNKDLPDGEKIVDPRFNLVKRGSAPNWEDLNNRWAMNDNYAQHILKIYNDMVKSPLSIGPIKEVKNVQTHQQSVKSPGLASWKQEEGEKGLDILHELGIVHDPEKWKFKLGEVPENWLLFVIAARLADMIDKSNRGKQQGKDE
jgi:N-acetylmuramoyl-L-alanine amidase